MDAIMVPELVSILRTSLLTDKRDLHAFMRASLKYLVGKDMSLFYLLLKTGEVVLPPLHASSDEETWASSCDSSRELKNQFNDMVAQGRAKQEVFKTVQILIIQAVKLYYDEHNTMQDYTFVCKSETHFTMLKDIVLPSTGNKTFLNKVFATFADAADDEKGADRVSINQLPEGYDTSTLLSQP